MTWLDAKGGYRSFLRDQRAVALTEFAVALPVLMTLYLGSYALSDAIACNRKVTTTTRAVADLTSQYSILSESGIKTILNSSTQILAPYSSAKAKISVSQLYTDNEGKTTVVWSEGINGASVLKEKSSFTLPGKIATKSTYLILAQVSYSYTPPVIFEGFGETTLSDSIYMSPRISGSVTKS